MCTASGFAATIDPRRGQASLAKSSAVLLDNDDLATALVTAGLLGREVTLKGGFRDLDYAERVKRVSGNATPELGIDALFALDFDNLIDDLDADHLAVIFDAGLWFHVYMMMSQSIAGSVVPKRRPAGWKRGTSCALPLPIKSSRPAMSVKLQ